MALGSFLTGLMLSDSEYACRIEAHVEIFRPPLPGLFFMSVGMSVDVNMLLVDWTVAGPPDAHVFHRSHKGRAALLSVPRTGPRIRLDDDYRQYGRFGLFRC